MKVRIAPASFENEAAVCIFLDVDVKFERTIVSFFLTSFNPKYCFKLIFVIPR